MGQKATEEGCQREKRSQGAWPQVCEGASTARCSFSVRCVSMYLRIFSTIQEGRTKDFSSSNFRSRHPLEQTLRRKVEARGCRPRLLLAATVRQGTDPLVLPVVIAGSEVPDVLLNEEVRLGQEQRTVITTSESFQSNSMTLY